jgi:hypothetical protein
MHPFVGPNYRSRPSSSSHRVQQRHVIRPGNRILIDVISARGDSGLKDSFRSNWAYRLDQADDRVGWKLDTAA